jgi:hypothetical protein
VPPLELDCPDGLELEEGCTAGFALEEGAPREVEELVGRALEVPLRALVAPLALVGSLGFRAEDIIAKLVECQVAVGRGSIPF